MTNNETDTTRGTNWFTLLAFSVIALVALLTELDGVSDESNITKWVVSAASISVAFSGLSVIAGALLKTKFLGTAIEGGLAFLLLCIWAAAMPYLMSAEENLAINADYAIHNANLYFFSWLSLATAFLLWLQYLRANFKICSGDKNKDFAPTMWAGLCLASFVVMVSAVRMYKDSGTCADGGARCNRTKFAIALGAVSAFISAFWLILGGLVHAMIDALMSVVLLVAWIFGIIYITFGGVENAPGAEIGNLYFATWISFVVTVVLTSAGVRGILMKGNEPEPTEGTPDEEQGKEEGDEEETPAEEIKA